MKWKQKISRNISQSKWVKYYSVYMLWRLLFADQINSVNNIADFFPFILIWMLVIYIPKRYPKLFIKRAFKNQNERFIVIWVGRFWRQNLTLAGFESKFIGKHFFRFSLFTFFMFYTSPDLYTQTHISSYLVNKRLLCSKTYTRALWHTRAHTDTHFSFVYFQLRKESMTSHVKTCAGHLKILFKVNPNPTKEI